MTMDPGLRRDDEGAWGEPWSASVVADAALSLPIVIPAEAGIQTGWPFGSIAAVRRLWIPAFAGMTGVVGPGVLLTLLPAARCPLPAARCPLPAARCPLPAARRLLPATFRLPTDEARASAAHPHPPK
ncbi:hypothetical protein SAQ01S_14160 [Sphingomonas aquatilis NBRC 16722]|nr:hypothetical protein SAQ01S_14160 [Sphingomonas aquatilis NBRC 16722]